LNRAVAQGSPRNARNDSRPDTATIQDLTPQRFKT